MNRNRLTTLSAIVGLVLAAPGWAQPAEAEGAPATPEEIRRLREELKAAQDAATANAAALEALSARVDSTVTSAELEALRDIEEEHILRSVGSSSSISPYTVSGNQHLVNLTGSAGLGYTILPGGPATNISRSFKLTSLSLALTGRLRNNPGADGDVRFNIGVVGSPAKYSATANASQSAASAAADTVAKSTANGAFLSASDVWVAWDIKTTKLELEPTWTLTLQAGQFLVPFGIEAVKFGSSLIGCPYYASREAFRAKGTDVDTDLASGDIRFVNLTGPAAVSAFLAGRIDAYGTHPATSTTATLYLQKQVTEITTAVPDGIYTTGGGRILYFGMRQWSKENPDLVKAFLSVMNRTLRWLNSDNGAHFDEAAQIAARELRIPKAVALYDLKDESTIAWSWGQTSYDDAVASIKKFQSWAISAKDPFYTKHHLSDEEIAAFVDKRFFAGGEYFVDTSKNRGAKADAGPSGGLAVPGALAEAVSGRGTR